MLQYFEKKGEKLFAIVPLSKSWIPRNIHLDTTSILQLLYNKGSRKIFNNFSEIKKEIDNIKNDKENCNDQIKNLKDEKKKLKTEIWNKIFYLDKIPGKKPFAFSIKTDGLSVSILLKKNKKIDIKNNNKLPKKGIINLEEINENQKKKILKCNKKIIPVDPGKQELICMVWNKEENENEIKKRINEKHKITKELMGDKFKYTQAQRRFECKMPIYNKIRRRIKTNKIKKLEKDFIKYNKKTGNFKLYCKYLKKRFSIEEEMYKHYKKILYRKLKFNIYKNMQKSEEKLIKNIKDKYDSKELVLAYGKWEGSNHLKGLSPVANKRIKRLLSKHFLIINTNENNTTAICNRCGEKVEKIIKREHPNYKRRRNEKCVMKDVRGLRKCTTCQILWNRDYHACLNIKDNFYYYLKNNEYHPKFKYKEEDETTKQ
jgi:hypothetical protein